MKMASVLKMALAFLHNSLLCGWGETFKRWSTKINAAQAVFLGFLGYVAYVGLTVPIWAILAGCAVFAGASMLASNSPQANVATYDPTRFRLVPIEGGDNADATSPKPE